MKKLSIFILALFLIGLCVSTIYGDEVEEQLKQLIEQNEMLEKKTRKLEDKVANISDTSIRELLDKYIEERQEEKGIF